MTDPNSFRMAPIDEKIERLRSGENWPSSGFVQGPPDKPRLPSGTSREAVTEAWGAPSIIVPARIERRGGVEFEELGFPPEIDALEVNEVWLFESGAGCFFEDGRLTSRAYSAATDRALETERLLKEKADYD